MIRKLPLAPVILFIAAVVNILPFFVNHIAGDIHIHLISLDCFGSQFYQGDLMPYWCFDSDAGAGSPILLFYFPLPYLAMMPFYPLHWAGVSLYNLYILCCFLATLITCWTCYRWLRDFSSEKAALLGTIFYLFFLYRTEVMVSRAGISELWMMAFAPLLMKAMRDLLLQRKRSVLKLSLASMLNFYCHIPATVNVLLASIIPFLGLGRWKQWLLGAGAALIGLALTLPYSLPALRFAKYTGLAERQKIDPPYANSFLFDWDYLTSNDARQMIGGFLCIFAVLLLAMLVFRKRSMIQDSFTRREALLWSGAGLFATFMLFPVSAPLWNLLNSIAHVGFPWRMLMVLQLVATYLFTVWLHNISKFSTAESGRGDIAMLLLMLLGYQYHLSTTVPDKSLELFNKMVRAYTLGLWEYRPVWTDKEHGDMHYAMERFDTEAYRNPTDVLGGECTYALNNWSREEIELFVTVWKPCSIRLNHRYFPTWKVQSDVEVNFRPEAKTGFMLLDVPKGKHTITIRPMSRLELLSGSDVPLPEPAQLQTDDDGL